MQTMQDTMTLDASGLRLTNDGYLIGDAKVSRAGNVQMYAGSELGMTGDSAAKMFGVYRDPDVVFDEASMLSLAGRPVTRGHPQSGVTAENWGDLAKGQVGGTIRRDGEHVVAPMAIMDATAAKEVAAGAQALSAGYSCQLIADEGVSPSGEPYQFRQAGPLRFNHVAYLPDNNPRAGNTRIGDDAEPSGVTPPANPPQSNKTGGQDMSDALQSVVLGDKAVSVPAASAPAIEAFKTDSAKALTDQQAEHDATLATKDAEIAKKDARIKELEDAQLTDAQIDERTAARAELISDAKSVAPDLDPKGLSDAEIRKAAVVAALGDEAIKDRSPAYIDVRFDVCVEDATKNGGTSTNNADPFRDHMKQQPATPPASDVKALDKAYDERAKRMQDAWKTPAKEKV